MHDALDGLDTFHLGHGDVHQDEVRHGAGVFSDGGAAIAGFANDLTAEGFDHLGQAFAREDGIVHDQVAHGLAVLFSSECFKLFHNYLLDVLGSPEALRAGETSAAGSICGRSTEHVA